MPKYRILLTGASSGIGMKTAALLAGRSWDVWGIGRDFSKTDRVLLENPHFHSISCDLMNRDELKTAVRLVRGMAGKEGGINVLINNAGAAWYGLHEDVSPESISAMVRTNLEVPMVLTGIFLRDFKRDGGTIINIASVTGEEYANPHGAAYGATKAGLLSFGRSIFEEARKCGVRVTTVMPDMTDTELYRSADFGCDPDAHAHLLPETVAEAVLYVLNQPDGVVVPELMLRPQLRRIRRKRQ
ncbi:MAG: SDR family oxidoreductase [Chordicoccus sp.]